DARLELVARAERPVRARPAAVLAHARRVERNVDRAGARARGLTPRLASIEPAPSAPTRAAPEPAPDLICNRVHVQGDLAAQRDMFSTKFGRLWPARRGVSEGGPNWRTAPPEIGLGLALGLGLDSTEPWVYSSCRTRSCSSRWRRAWHPRANPAADRS